MSPRRIVLRLLPALAAAASLTASLAVSSAAEAATASPATTNFIDVQTAPNGVSPSADVGSVSVNIAATSPLTSLTVSVYSGVGAFASSCSGGTDVLDLPLSAFVQPANDGNGQLGTWTLSSPITTSQLSLGNYEVCLTAADQGGDTADSIVGPLYYLNTVEFPTFTASRTSFSFDHQDVTLAGVAQLLAPDGTTTPFGGQTLSVTGPDFLLTTAAVTSADGSFSVSFQVPMSGPYWVFYNNDGSTGGSSAIANLNVSTLSVRLTAALTASHVKEGQRVFVHGTVTYAENGVRKPEAGAKVLLCNIDTGYSCNGQVPSSTTNSTVTDAHGKFTMRVPSTGSTTWTVATLQSIYFHPAAVNRSLSVALRNAITNFKAKVSSFAVVTYSGCVIAQPSGVVIEYAAKKTGPWRRLKIKPVDDGSLCTPGHGTGLAFSGTAIAHLAAAYYRAVFPASRQWQLAVSRSVFLRKYLTKITSFSVTPRNAVKGDHIRVSGRLWAENGHGRWQPYGQRRVLVVFRYRGAWYRYRVEPKTSKAGWFSGRFPVYSSSRYFSQYDGDKAHFACASTIIKATSAASGSPGFWPGLRVPRAEPSPLH